MWGSTFTDLAAAAAGAAGAAAAEAAQLAGEAAAQVQQAGGALSLDALRDADEDADATDDAASAMAAEPAGAADNAKKAAAQSMGATRLSMDDEEGGWDFDAAADVDADNDSSSNGNGSNDAEGNASESNARTSNEEAAAAAAPPSPSALVRWEQERREAALAADRIERERTAAELSAEAGRNRRAQEAAEAALEEAGRRRRLEEQRSEEERERRAAAEAEAFRRLGRQERMATAEEKAAAVVGTEGGCGAQTSPTEAAAGGGGGWDEDDDDLDAMYDNDESDGEEGGEEDGQGEVGGEEDPEAGDICATNGPPDQAAAEGEEEAAVAAATDAIDPDIFYTPATKAPAYDGDEDGDEDLLKVETVESMIHQTASMLGMGVGATSLLGAISAEDDEYNYDRGDGDAPSNAASNESNDGMDQEMDQLQSVSEGIREEVLTVTLPEQDDGEEEVGVAAEALDVGAEEPASAAGGAEQDQPPTAASIPQDVLDKLMDQMQRMNAEHQSELENVESQHRREMAELEERYAQQLNDAQTVTGSDPSIHDKCLSKMRKLEVEFNERLDAKENDLAEVVQKNQGMRLKLDAVQRELEGTSKLLEARGGELSDLRQGHDQNVQGIDSQLQAARKEVKERDEVIRQLKVRSAVF